MRDEEESTAALLRLAGVRLDPSADRTARVRMAVHQEWRTAGRRRTMRRRAAIAIASLAAAAAFVLMVREKAPPAPQSPPAASVATAGRTEGAPLARRRIDDRVVGLRLHAGDALRANDAIETDATSRAAWTTADGSSVRLDRSSRARLVSQAVIELGEGAVYIATVDGAAGFEVQTPLGTARDAGTRFEVRLGAASLRVRVRTGLVELRRGEATVRAGAGTEATVASSGMATRSVSIHGPDWGWISTLGSPFPIEGRSLSAYLEYLSAEQGWTVRYANARLAQAASTIILHGSVEGLEAEEAVGVALRTSGLQYRLREGDLLVSAANAQ
jgi:ferric-dicitrate binding protein FerR (iron transport regulator)